MPKINIPTILMADDDEEDQMLVRDALEESRLVNPLECVNDGIELLEYLRGEGPYADRTQYPFPALVLLDVNMPRMDGLEALAEIRKDPSIPPVPIIVLTTSDVHRDILKSYGLGANTFITKPVTLDQLVETVQILGEYWFAIAKSPVATHART